MIDAAFVKTGADYSNSYTAAQLYHRLIDLPAADSAQKNRTPAV